ncbi:hypothetical protein IPA_04280 [Ignicoccus pacificus DSM 13166]|uniref:Metanogen output domain-containing protein n=1 Tax=Ignicoccus pacificus DSM 13166 TaxID=940294 RepID=A0A977KC39_9CREN|nr:hypothetical protein IPA_04280 [Ignicoccus pacificus DSM 13166]
MSSEEFANLVIKKMLFKYMIPELSKLLGDNASETLVYRVLREATKDVADEVKLSEKIELKDICDVFKYVYSMFGNEEVECIEEGGKLKIIVRRCPLVKMVGSEPRACLVAASLKAGIIEGVMKKTILLETKSRRYGSPNAPIRITKVKSIVDGDEYCEFVVEE